MSDHYSLITPPAFLFAPREYVDIVLRLLEQEEITRAKARETLAQLWRGRQEALPTDRLNWCDPDPAPTC